MIASKKILIVEDEEDIAMLLKKRLQSEGFSEIEHAVDGIQAVQRARRFRPDLILLDILMPGWDGLNVLGKIKMSTLTRDTPVLVITGMQNDLKKKEILEQGVRGYFQKPYDVKDLISAINGALTPAS